MAADSFQPGTLGHQACKGRDWRIICVGEWDTALVSHCLQGQHSSGRQQSTRNPVWLQHLRSSEGLCCWPPPGWWQNTRMKSRRLEFEFLPATSVSSPFLSMLLFVMEGSDGLQKLTLLITIPPHSTVLHGYGMLYLI